MSAIVTYSILIVQDKRGQVWSGVVNEMADTTEVYGLATPKGEPLHFRGEAYHMKLWCEDNGLRYAEHSRQEEIFI